MLDADALKKEKNSLHFLRSWYATLFSAPGLIPHLQQTPNNINNNN